MGAGAVGSYYGALLARHGHDVTLVARGAHLDAIRAAGHVTVREADGTLWRVPVTAADRARGVPDLVIVATKSHHTLQAARALADAVGSDTIVLSLQNGVENVERIRGVLGGAGTVLGAICFVGLRIDEPGVVDHQAEGRVAFGDPAGGRTEAAERVWGWVRDAWTAEPVEDIVREQWHKLLWNIGFNALCAVTGATAGEALATPESRALVRQAMEEVVAIARNSEVDIGAAEVADMSAYNRNLRDYRPSTAQDIAAGKPVEREALTGFVVRRGAVLGLDTPVNRVLDALLALQEDRATGRIARRLAELDAAEDGG